MNGGLPSHPIVRLALELVTRPAPQAPELTAEGRDRLRDALRGHQGTPEMQSAALALLELAYFLASQGARAVAEAIGDVVAAEAGAELQALAGEKSAGDDLRAQAARKLLGESTAVPSDASDRFVTRGRKRKPKP